MADKKISALTASTTPLAGTEVLPIAQGASTVKVSVANLTAGRPVATGIITATAPAASQAVFTGWAPTGGASTSNGSITFGAGVGAQGYVSYDATGPFVGALYLENTYDDNSATIRFRTRNVDRLVVQGNGDLTASTGNLVLGTAGKGIDFSANTHAAGMTSELLDWYEEGDWTPTQGNFGTWTDPVFSATYTRIGRSVTLNVRQNAGTIESGGAGKYIAGLPFAPATAGSTGIAINGSGITVSNLLLYSDGNIYFISDTGSQSSVQFALTYMV
jgi:hypothetical protein